MSGITVVGSVNADLTVRLARHPKPGETLLGEGGDFSAGGKGANQAVAAGLLGADVRLVGAVGSDAPAEIVMGSLRRSGVDMSAVEVVDGPTGLAVITVADSGENTITVIPGANSHVNDDFVQRYADAVSDASVVLLQGEIPASGLAQAVRLSTGRVVINLAPVVPVSVSDLLKADPLVVNEHEAELVLGTFATETDVTTPAEMAEQLIAEGLRSVIVTLGADGALVADSTGVVQVPSPSVDAVDTTGCGDAFVGALVSRIADGDSLLESARFATRVGAYAATGRGAQDSYPTRADSLPEVS